MAKENELSRSSFQTDLFLEEYPAPEGFPSDEELFSCPPSLKGFFWPADSWAWGFADMFPPEYVPQDRAWEDLIAKESLCVKGTIKKNLPPRPRHFKMIINRVFGRSATGGKPKFQRWLSNLVLPKRQDIEGLSRWDAATCFVIWHFGGAIPYDAVAKHISTR